MMKRTLKELPPPLRFCYRCRKRKSLQAFRTITGAYDPRLCNICRWNKSFTVGEAKARVEKGLSPKSVLDRAVRERAEKYKQRHETEEDNLRKEMLATWKPVIASARLARYQLRKFKPATPEQETWARSMRELIDEAVQLCKEMEIAKPDDTLVFWYDVLPPGKVRALIQDFPSINMEQAPLAIL